MIAHLLSYLPYQLEGLQRVKVTTKKITILFFNDQLIMQHGVITIFYYIVDSKILKIHRKIFSISSPVKISIT